MHGQLTLAISGSASAIIVVCVVVLVPLVGLLLLHLLGPLVVLGTAQMNEDALIEIIDEDSVDAATAEHLNAVRVSLECLGFESVFAFTLDGFVRASSHTGLVFENPRDSTLAMAATVFVDVGSGPAAKARYVEFTTRMADGRDVLTNNCPQAIDEGLCLGKDIIQARRVADRALYALHQAHTSRRGRAYRPIPATPEALYDRIIESVTEPLRMGEKSGYITRVGEGPIYKPTLRGAFLMTWKVIWPWSAARWARHAARVRELKMVTGNRPPVSRA